MEPNLLPVKEHIELLLNGDVHDLPCDSCQPADLEINLPPWFDKEKYKRGQHYIWKNLFAQYGVTLCGLICVLAVPSILKILMGTNKSSTAMTAYRRYLSTIKHIYSWYSDELKPGTTAWKSLMTVRTRHLRASMTSMKKGGSHISQRDLVFTQFSFYGFGLIKAKTIGMVQGNEEDIEGYVHFWRTVGYMMGIDDKFNLCRPSLQETREVTEAICNEVYCQLLRDPPEYFLFMTTELINGLWNVMPLITVKSFIYFTYTIVGVPGFYTTTERVGGIPNTIEGHQKPNQITMDLHMSKKGLIVDEKLIDGGDIYKAMTSYDKLMLRLCFYMFGSGLANTFLRIYSNSQIKLTMFLVTYFPFLVLPRFGIRNSYVNMFAEDITAEATPETNRDIMSTSYARLNNTNYDKVYSTCTTTVRVAKNVH